MVTVRKYRPGDRSALYEVCLRTGSDGEDASALYRDPRLLGEVYVGPYLQFAPEFALVAEDDEGIGGYAFGALETKAFEAACESSWWPPLRRRYPLGAAGERSANAAIVRIIHDPPVAPDGLVGEFPAHLHIDLLPRFQGRGYGRAMMTTLFEALAQAGARGVHLGVSRRNTRAIGFYKHLGMSRFGETDDTVIMTLPLAPRPE